MITVVGLGVKAGDLTKEGEAAILKTAETGGKIFVRTAKTPSYESVKALGVPHETLDYVYEKSRTFATLNKNLCRAVRGGGENAAYLVDGAASEDNSVKAILRAAGRKNVRVIGGVSKISAIASAASFAECSYQAVSACEICDALREEGLSAPLITYDIDGEDMAADVKQALSDRFGEETEILFIRLYGAGGVGAAGADGGAGAGAFGAGGAKNCAPVVKKIKIYELDRQKNYDCGCAAAVEKVALLDKKRFTMNDVLTILRRLRDPVNGCPWDKVQTSESIRMNVIEEAYELLDAINLKDDDKIREETGDLLMQVAFHSMLKEESGAFDFADVATELCEKLITRHTHVFGKDKAIDAESALSVWDKNKMIEKSQDTFAKSVNDVPKCFPALLQAQKVEKRVERGGWDKPTFAGAKAALESELDELKTASENEKAGRGSKDDVAGELGDALFCMATMARAVGADAEEALLDTVRKVQRRYTEYENLVLADGKDVNALSKTERDEYYARVKEAEREKRGGERGNTRGNEGL